MPPPTHIVTIPYRPLRRSSSRRMLAVNFAPVHPSGWPKAIAPPLTFTFSGSRSQRLDHGDRLRRKSFVQLDYIDFVQASGRRVSMLSELRTLVQCPSLQADSPQSRKQQTRHRLRAERLRAFVRHHDRRRGAVRHLRRIAGGDRSLHMKRGLEFRQPSADVSRLTPSSLSNTTSRRCFLPFSSNSSSTTCQRHNFILELVCIQRSRSTRDASEAQTHPVPRASLHTCAPRSPSPGPCSDKSQDSVRRDKDSAE